jgi:hypothetical protein
MALKSVKQFSQDNPAFSEAALRWQIFHADKNGLAKAGAIIRWNGRVYIDDERYVAHMRAESKRQQEPA